MRWIRYLHYNIILVNACHELCEVFWAIQVDKLAPKGACSTDAPFTWFYEQSGWLWEVNNYSGEQSLNLERVKIKSSNEIKNLIIFYHSEKLKWNMEA